MANEFQLRALISAVLAESLTPDTQTLTQEVSARIRRAELRDALEQALPYVIRTMTKAHGTTYAPPRDDVAVIGAAVPSERLEAPAPHGGRHDAATRKADMIRDWVERLKNTRLPGEVEDKFFVNFTVADVAAAALRRETHAASVSARARQLRELEAVMVAEGAETVGDLPDAVLRSVVDASTLASA